MSPAALQVLQQLESAFPERAVIGVITPHECDECSSMRMQLEGKTWCEVANEFAEEFAGSLPLLTSDAYNAYLPVWLRAAVVNPDGESANMIPINLANEPSHASFTAAQVAALTAVVEYVTNNNRWGAEDPTNVEAIKAVKAEWGDGAA
jgi:hypothetical protein